MLVRSFILILKRLERLIIISCYHKFKIKKIHIVKKNLVKRLHFEKKLRYSLNIKRFDNQTNFSGWWNMEPDFNTVNDYLVSVFNDILTIEGVRIKKSQFKDLSITEMHTIEAIGMYKKKKQLQK